MSEIGENVVFKRDSGESVSLLQKFVGLHSRPEGLLTVNFRAPEMEIVDVKEFFQLLQSDETIKMDIGGTGDIECSFKGMSPILEHKEKNTCLTYYSLSITMQDIAKKESWEESPGCGCG